MYIKTDTQTPMSISQIRAAHPNMSIPDGADLTEFGYATLTDAPVTPAGYTAQRGNPELVDGVWRYAYTYNLTVPQAVTMRQARLALLAAGKLTTANAAITAMPGTEGDAARIEWEYAHEVRRDAALVAGMASVLGLTSEQLDELFIAAAAIN